MFALASHLHRPVYELEDMPYSELIEWMAYFSIQNAETKKALRRK